MLCPNDMNQTLLKLFQKSQNNNIIFYEKQQKIWNLVFSFMYLVSVYPTDRTLVTYINSGQKIGEGGVKK